MLELSVFIYGLLTGFVLLSAQNNRRAARPNPAMVTAVGWGLFSMSSTLAVLCAGLALAMACGVSVGSLVTLG